MGWTRESSLLRKLIPAVLPALSISLASVDTAHAQCVRQSITNGTITATVGISGTPSGVTPAINCAGRFGVTEGGATGATLLNDAVAAVKQSYVTVRIDGGPPTPGVDAASQTAPGWDLIFGDVGTNALNATNANAKTDQGGWVIPPSVQNNVLVATWTTLPGGNATFPIPRIEVSLRMTLVHDMVSYQFTVVNRDTAAHTVALRFAQDFTTPGTTDGPVITPNLGQISTDADLIGATVPTFWRARNTATDQSVGATLRSASGSSSSVLTSPARLTFGAPSSTNLPLWDFVANPLDNFSVAPGDAGSGVYFNIDNYAPSAGKVITTYFGKQTSSINFDAPWAAGVQGPFSLKYDPSQPVGQQLTPNPFTVSAFVQNLSQLTLTNVTAVLSLPAGLKLATGENASKSVASLDIGAETSFSWQVVPDGTQSGRLTYSVAFSAGPGAQGKVVTRDIDVPSLPTQSFTAGIQMVSFPYVFDDPSPTKALGLNVGTFDLLRWNPAISTYEAVSQIRPGDGYWLRLPANTNINLVGATPLATTTKFEIKLLKDWNQIGNPYLFRVRWADLTVVTTDVGDPNYLVPLTVSQAAQQGLIAPTIYFYDTSNGAYRFDQDFSTELVPFQGYWVKALKSNVSLLVPPSSGRSASIKPDSQTRAVSSNGWLMRIQASTGKSIDNWNFIGVSSGASDGYDLKDYEKPPFIQDAVRLQFTRDSWGTRAGGYAQDIQAANGAKKTWNMTVTTPAPNQDVTLTWPEVASVPRSYELFITDLATGQRRQMRQTSSIRINTGNATSRAFTITAEPRVGAGVFQLSIRQGITGKATGTMSFDVSSTQDASIMLRIKGASGQTVRTLTGRSASLGNTASFMWDSRDAKGTSVAAGSYIVEVTGTTSDGETRKIIQPIIVVR